MNNLSLPSVERGLKFHERRHNVIASNIVNAETPGYRPFDLELQDAGETASTMAVTDPRHYATSDASTPTRERLVRDESSDPNPNGNAVDLEMEAGKLRANKLRYNALVEVLKRRLGMVRYAATDGR